MFSNIDQLLTNQENAIKALSLDIQDLNELANSEVNTIVSMLDNDDMARRIKTEMPSLSRFNTHLIDSSNKYALLHRHIRDGEIFQSCDTMWEDLSFFLELHDLHALGF